ncbi:plant cysteine oxidase 1-like isoform X2 [Panicum miliaceum]|uniref:cysteine dioxygenase n=1 Tax=Panicum miliaceum TaxID=4540 RepID=A0A3L6SH03_PANMI|nr:plant cysteine oxidase 1-like isoform X2 [Panicum miliaceum]
MISTPTNSATSTIQKIYDISRDVFAAATPGFVPPPSDVERLTGFLDNLTLQDIGLDASMSCFTANPQDHPKVTYIHFATSPTLSLYDWVTASDSNQVTRMPNGARLAKLHTDAIFDATSKTVVLYPEDGGNLHCFNAMSPCAVLDVMGPPYCLKKEGIALTSVVARLCMQLLKCQNPDLILLITFTTRPHPQEPIATSACLTVNYYIALRN